MRWNPLPDDRDIGWTPYVWLVYVLPMLIVAWFHPDRAISALFVAVTLLFLPLYFWGYWRRGWDLLPTLIALVGLGFVMSFFNFAGSVFYIYAAGFLGGIGSNRRAYSVLVIIAVICVLQAAIFDFHVVQLIVPPAICFVVGLPNIHFGERERIREDLLAAERELAELSRAGARDAERERIARDLHDLLGHSLSSIVLKSQLAAKLVGRDPTAAAKEMREVEHEARRALDETRSAIRGWRKREFSDELRIASRTLTTAGVALETKVTDARPGSLLETTLALLLREAVTNVVRHAHAQTCHVGLDHNGRWELTVEDDGVGLRGPPGTGIQGMRARVDSMSGEMRCEVGAGTRLQFVFPPEGQA